MPPEPWSMPEEAVTERFLAATGPGGQNVNKAATAVQMRVDVYALRLAPEVFARLRTLAGSRMTGDGAIVITARRFRTQEANRSDARLRIGDLLRRAHQRPMRRVKTRPSKAAKAKRLDGKAIRGGVKKGRGRVELD